MGAGKNKVSNRVNYISRKSYNEFKKKYPDDTTTYEEFMTILKESNKTITKYVLENPLGFKFPKNLGYLAVDKFKTNKDFVAVDWPNTLKYKKLIPLTNFHSFGYAYKLYFYKNMKILPFRAYKITPQRLIKRLLAKKIKEGDSEYVKIDRSYFNKRFRIENILNKQ